MYCKKSMLSALTENEGKPILVPPYKLWELFRFVIVFAFSFTDLIKCYTAPTIFFLAENF